MCFPSAPKDNSAQIAREREDQRQRDIEAGTAQVNDIFDQFDDDYFGGIQSAHSDYYMPQLQDQYERARRKLVLQLGGAGTLASSAGARQLGELDKRYQTQRADYANQGVSLAEQYRGDVERNRAEVLNQLNASANPSAAAATASARAQSLMAPPTFSPIGNLFTDLVTQAGTGLAAERAGHRGYNTGLFSGGGIGGSGSQTITRT